MFLDGRETALGLFLFLSLLIDLFELFSNVFYELDDGLVVEVEDAVFDLFSLLVVVEVVEEGVEELADAVLDDHLLQNFADNEFSNELDVAENLGLSVLQVDVLVFLVLELGELLQLFIE